LVITRPGCARSTLAAFGGHLVALLLLPRTTTDTLHLGVQLPVTGYEHAGRQLIRLHTSGLNAPIYVFLHRISFGSFALRSAS
jgi:hypothetical protein